MALTKNGGIPMTAQEEADFLAQKAIDNAPGKLLFEKRQSMILTRTQFFLQLKASGHFSGIKTLFAGKQDDDTQRIRFENAATFERLDADVIAIATTALGMDDAAMDAFFESGMLL